MPVSLKRINQAVDHFVKKHWLSSLATKFLWLLGLYSLFQNLFELPNLRDLSKYLTATTWSVNISSMVLKGSVQILTSSDNQDSLIAWSNSEAFIPMKISNKVSQNLIIDSIRGYSGFEKNPLEYNFVVEKGILNSYRDSYILAGKEDVDLLIQPIEIKGNRQLLESIIKGRQRVIVFTDRGRSEMKITHFLIKDGAENILKEIRNP